MLAYTKPTTKTLEDAIQSVHQAVDAHGFKVLNVLNIGEILKTKGFEREPIVILEVCHAKSAAAMLSETIDIGLLLPCKINVYRHDGEIYISALDPTMISQFFDQPSVTSMAKEIAATIRSIVDDAI